MEAEREAIAGIKLFACTHVERRKISWRERTARIRAVSPAHKARDNASFKPCRMMPRPDTRIYVRPFPRPLLPTANFPAFRPRDTALLSLSVPQSSAVTAGNLTYRPGIMAGYGIARPTTVSIVEEDYESSADAKNPGHGGLTRGIDGPLLAGRRK